jgi:hypothetical protein
MPIQIHEIFEHIPWSKKDHWQTRRDYVGVCVREIVALREAHERLGEAVSPTSCLSITFIGSPHMWRSVEEFTHE